MRIETDGTRKSHVCHGGRVEIWADEVRLTLTGSCGELSVHGELNSIYVSHTDDLNVGGSRSVVFCQSKAKEVYREIGPPDSRYTSFHTIINCDP